MQENDGYAASRSRLDDVQVDSVGFDCAVFKFHFCTASKTRRHFTRETGLDELSYGTFRLVVGFVGKAHDKDQKEIGIHPG